MIDKKSVKKAIQDTFTNRGTNIQKISIPKDQIDTIQNYWGIYLKALDAEIQKELDARIQAVMNEINNYLTEKNLFD